MLLQLQHLVRLQSLVAVILQPALKNLKLLKKSVMCRQEVAPLLNCWKAKTYQALLLYLNKFFFCQIVQYLKFYSLVPNQGIGQLNPLTMSHFIYFEANVFYIDNHKVHQSNITQLIFKLIRIRY